MAITSPNIGLRIWNHVTDRYDHSQLADNFVKLDFHDHSPGRGQPIPTEGFLDGSITSSKLSNTAALKGVGTFRAYRDEVLSAATTDEIVFDTESFDFSNWYDPGNGRYTPELAGYYDLAATITFDSTIGADQYLVITLLKNGTVVSEGVPVYQRAAARELAASVRDIVSANGTTDYFTIGIIHNVGSAEALSPLSQHTHFEGFLVGRS